VARSITRAQVLGFRVRAQQLDRDRGTLANTAVLDIGVQDTGPDGARWALAIRGLPADRAGDPSPADTALVWSIRGAPHLYRRKDLNAVATAVAPYSEVDAAKRLYDAAKPLKAAGIGILDALDAVATQMHAIVTRPTAKGEVSTRLSKAMDEPYLRWCRPCQATHLYEQPFRLAALRAGLELEPDTSPPVLRRISGFAPVRKPNPRFDLIRAYLRLLGPATPKTVADYLDAPVKDVTERWPRDVTEVTVGGERRWVLTADLDALGAGPASTTRLLGPFDLYLQLRDRPSLVDTATRAKALWPVLGRPGAVLRDGEVAGLWRPRQAGRRLGLKVDLWAASSPALRTAVEEQAARLAAYRDTELGKIEYA
jgi:hypothetical protein